MVIKHKIELSPGRWVEIETELPPLLLAGMILAVTLSIYNLYR